jgi:hypothetical protein
MLERTFTVIEAMTLALWIGALAGFAFVFAPIAFGIVSDVEQFGRVTAAVLRALTPAGSVCGGIAIVAALVRASDPSQRASALARVAIVVTMLALMQYESRAIVPRMEAALPGLARGATPQAQAAFRAEHDASTRVYGSVFLLGLIAIGLAAVARPEPRSRFTHVTASGPAGSSARS